MGELNVTALLSPGAVLATRDLSTVVTTVVLKNEVKKMDGQCVIDTCFLLFLYALCLAQSVNSVYIITL